MRGYDPPPMTPAVLLLQAAAALFSLLGWLLLVREGAFGSGRSIGLGEGSTLLATAAVYAWWMSPIAALTRGVKGAALALVVIDVLWVVLAMGAAGFAFCAVPICAPQAPFSDIGRYGSVIFGAAAAWSAWRAYRAMPGPTQWAPAVTAVVLIVVAFALQGVNAAFP